MAGGSFRRRRLRKYTLTTFILVLLLGTAYSVETQSHWHEEVVVVEVTALRHMPPRCRVPTAWKHTDVLVLDASLLDEDFERAQMILARKQDVRGAKV